MSYQAKKSKNGSYVSSKIDVTVAPTKYVQVFCNICSQNVTFQQEWALPACVRTQRACICILHGLIVLVQLEADV